MTRTKMPLEANPPGFIVGHEEEGYGEEGREGRVTRKREL